MKAYRLSVNLKLGLIVFAVMIAVASLYYTSQLVDRLREREQFVIQLWAKASEQVAQASQHMNPYLAEFQALSVYLEAEGGTGLTQAERETYRSALAWARSMPPAGEVTLASEILTQGNFGIPAIIIDSTLGVPVIWQNVPVADTLGSASSEAAARATARLQALAGEMAEVYAPIPIALGMGEAQLKQYLFYDESSLIKELRAFPYVQLLFVSLFIGVGYLGFSYVRRSEQSSLWVGMAKEAAHQLGTPISSLLGWIELMRMDDPSPEQAATLDEVEKDVSRLRRVTNRFSDIGSLPKLEVMQLAPVVGSTADYIRRRMPQGGRVTLNVDVPDGLASPLNAELFEWVVENLLKNALDAIETHEGSIDIRAYRDARTNVIEVKDTGKGIDRRHWKNVFRPGYSTKKRGWGLGLSLAKRIVEDYHGGELNLAESRPGHGTTFEIRLPAAASVAGQDGK